MKRSLITLALLFALLIPTQAAISLVPNNPPGSVRLAWDPSPDSDIATYIIYYGTESGVYTQKYDAGLVLDCKIGELARGVRYYFAATCINSNGLESAFSNEVAYEPPRPPLPPRNLEATNAVVKVSLLRAPSPEGPWSRAVDFGQVPVDPGYYQSSVDIAAVTPPLQVAKAAIVSKTKTRIPPPLPTR